MPKLYAGQPQILTHNLVTAAGFSLTSAGAATASFYVRADSGANAGKWYRGSDTSWQSARSIAGAGTFVSGSQWSIALPTLTLGVGTYTVTAEHSTATQFAYDRTYQVEVLPGGAGSYAYTITVTLDGSVVDGADVWITTDAAGNNIVAGKQATDDNGQVAPLLDAGTFRAWVQLAGATFTNPTTITVSASGTGNTKTIAGTTAAGSLLENSSQLCTLAQAKRALGLADSDAEHDQTLTQIIQQVSAACEGPAGSNRRLTQHTVDQVFRADRNQSTLFTPCWPVVSVGVVTERAMGELWADGSTLTEDVDYEVDYDRGHLIRYGYWMPGARTVQAEDLVSGYVSPVTSSAGGFVIATGQVLMPDDIVGAAVQQTVHAWNKRRDPAKASEGAGGASLAANASVAPGELLPGVVQVMGKYRRVTA